MRSTKENRTVPPVDRCSSRGNESQPLPGVPAQVPQFGCLQPRAALPAPHAIGPPQSRLRCSILVKSTRTLRAYGQASCHLANVRRPSIAAAARQRPRLGVNTPCDDAGREVIGRTTHLQEALPVVVDATPGALVLYDVEGKARSVARGVRSAARTLLHAFEDGAYAQDHPSQLQRCAQAAAAQPSNRHSYRWQAARRFVR
jgi:hypothetical protein